LPPNGEDYLEASVSFAELASCCHFVACFRKQLGRVINGRKAESWAKVRNREGNSISNRSPGNDERFKFIYFYPLLLLLFFFATGRCDISSHNEH
jgi:hypothetical protein